MGTANRAKMWFAGYHRAGRTGCHFGTKCYVGNEEVPAFKGLPRDIPALRLCRLAVAESRKKQGLGQYMMGFVLAKAITIDQDAGLSGILIDAKNDDAKGYYQLFGFVPLTTDPLTLFLPMASIMELVRE